MRAARLPVQPVRSERGRRRGPRSRDDRALEYGKGIPRVVAIEDEHGRRTGKASLDIARITGDPFQTGDAEAVSDVSRKRDDPALGFVRKPQEVAIGIDRMSIVMREIRVPTDLDACIP